MDRKRATPASTSSATAAAPAGPAPAPAPAPPVPPGGSEAGVDGLIGSTAVAAAAVLAAVAFANGLCARWGATTTTGGEATRRPLASLGHPAPAAGARTAPTSSIGRAATSGSPWPKLRCAALTGPRRPNGCARRTSLSLTPPVGSRAADAAGSGLGAESARPAPLSTTGSGSGIGKESAGEADAGTSTCATGIVMAGVAAGAGGGEADGAGAGGGDEDTLGTGAGTAATEARSTSPPPAWASAAPTTAWAVAGTSGSAVTADGTPGTPVAACAPAGIHRAAASNAGASAHAIRCPNNFRNERSTMISFLSLYVAARVRSDPKKGPNSCYLWYFHL